MAQPSDKKPAASFFLTKKRKDKKSKLALKPCYYTINIKALYEYLENVDPALSKFKKMESLLNEARFEDLATELLRAIYFGDLVLLRLFLETLAELKSKKPSKSKKKLIISQRVMSAYVDAIKLMLVKVSRKAKENEIKRVLAEFDRQIQRCIRFFETGKLD